MSDLARRFLAFFLTAATVAAVAGILIYAAVQQDLRQGANDPQEQLAEDAAAALDAGAAPASVVGAARVDLTASLAPFVAVYAVDGTVLATDGVLDGRPPVPPSGVLESARSTGRDAVTWQPDSGVRMALVVLPWHGGTVAAGRSLRRVEETEARIETLVAAGGLVAILAVGLAALVSARIWPRHAAREP